jgi:hypothetical protein
MKKVRVYIPFIDGETGVMHESDSEPILSESTIERALAISPNMLVVLGDVETEKPKKRKTKTE